MLTGLTTKSRKIIRQSFEENQAKSKIKSITAVWTTQSPATDYQHTKPLKVRRKRRCVEEKEISEDG